MDDDAQKSALLTALTTEHFVMQTALSAAISEGQSRASIFIGALSGALVAMGFAVQVAEVFVPFVATVLPALVVMGMLTTLRLVDISVESALAEVRIARIRAYYRTLSHEAAGHFPEALGRWPERAENPDLRLGAFLGYWTTAASMTATLTALVAGASVVLMLRLVAGLDLVLAFVAGGIVLAVLLYAFHHYQKLRIAESARFAHHTAGLPD